MSTVQTAQALAAEGKGVEAGVMLCVGLMSHDPSDPLRQGYTIGNALMAAASLLDLDRNQVAAVADRLVAPLVEASAEVGKGINFDRLNGADKILVRELRAVLSRFGWAPR